MKFLKYALLGAVALSFTTPAVAKDLLIGSTSASSSHYGYFVSVGQLINKSGADVSATIVETGATIDNIKRIDRGQLDLGLVTTNAVQHALTGTNKFKGHPQDLRLLWVYTIAPQNVVVRSDSGVSSLEGLKGVRFNPGIKGSSTEATTEAVFSTLGLSADFVRGSTTDIVGGIKDNRLAGYVKSGSGKRLDGSTMDIATATDINVLGLTKTQQGTLSAKMPDVSLVNIPAGAGKDIPAYTTWGFGVGVAAPASLGDDDAYAIVKAIFEDKKLQGEAMAAVKGVNLAEMTLEYSTIPLHAGVLRWYKEQGIKVPAHLMGSK